MAKPPVKKSTSRALVPWEKEMAEAAKRQAKAEKIQGGFPSISTRGGILSIDDTPVDGGELRVCVLLSVHENQYFTSDFDPNNFIPPVCYAFGDPESDEPDDGMAPHEKSSEPQGDDHGLCAKCWANEMGSADKGRGKACKNVRRLAVVTEDALESAEALEDAEVRVLKIPVMSVKDWGVQVHRMSEDMGITYWGAIMTLKCIPDAKSTFRVQLKFDSKIDFTQELYEAMKRKIAEVTPTMMAPYPEPSEQEPAPRGARGNARPAAPQRRAAPARAPAPAPAPRRPAAPPPVATKAPGKPVKVPVKSAPPARAPKPPVAEPVAGKPARRGFVVPVKTNTTGAPAKRAPKF